MSKPYSEADIKVLKGLEAIKQRPGMYVGDTSDGTGLLSLLWEVVSNSMDQFLAGHCSTISITLHPNNSIEVSVDGIGMPPHDIDGKSFIERVMTQLHFSATYDGHAPHTHVGGVRGVGLSVVNAHSSSVVIDVFKERYHYQQGFQGGEALPLERLDASESTGTRIQFTPSSDVFSSLQIDQGAITRRLKELSCLNKGISFQFEDLRVIKNIFENSDGVVGLLDSVTYKHLIKGCSESQGVSVDVAMGWNGSQTKIQSYANQLCTKDGGLHEAGLIDGLSKAIKEFGGCLSDTDKLSELISDGLHAVVHVNIADPKYANPTIDRLINPEAQDAVSEVLKKLVLEYLNENSKFASSIIEQYISKEVYAVLLKKDIKS